MLALALVLLALALLAGFLALARFEARRGARFLAASRARLDARLEHLAFVYTHTDWAVLVRSESKKLLEHLLHVGVHYVLIAVRGVERALTRLVRELRARVERRSEPPEGEPRAFIKTLSGFKENIAPRPLSDIQ